MDVSLPLGFGSVCMMVNMATEALGSSLQFKFPVEEARFLPNKHMILN